MTRSALRLLASVPAVCLLAVPFAGGCGKSETTATPHAGGASGFMSSGGDSGSSSDGGTSQGGSNSTGVGGSAGSQANSGSGGIAGSAGGADSGGASGSAGSSGSGPTGVVGTLGGDCAPPGSLACAGNYQKLSLVCGADGKWATNQTCGDGEFCDTTQGPNAGTCTPQTPECEGLEPGGQFCVDQELRECGPDTVTSTSVMQCELSCTDGACSDCPEAPGINCADDCGGPNEDCMECYLDPFVRPPVLRVGTTCPIACPDGSTLHVFGTDVGPNNATPRIVNVSPPWRALAFAYGESPTGEEFCDLYADALSCVDTTTVETNPDVITDINVFVFTTEPSPPPQNVFISPPDGAGCPP